MARSRTTALVFVLFMAPLATCMFVSACSGSGAEQTLIRAYFTAARVRVTGSHSTTSRWSRSIPVKTARSRPSRSRVSSEEQRRPLRLKELSAALITAQQAEDDFTAEKVTYQDEQFDAINRVLLAERDGEDVARRDVEVQEAWTDWRTRTIEHAKMVSGARVELSNEENAASLSVFDPSTPVEVTEYDGELLTKDVSVTASVELDGTESERSMVIKLQKAVLVGSDGTVIEGRWVVAQIG